MNIALVNKITKIVENIAVPPEGTNVYFVSPEYDAVPSDTARIGDIYDNGIFVTPNN